MLPWPTQDPWNIKRKVEKINPSPFPLKLFQRNLFTPQKQPLQPLSREFRRYVLCEHLSQYHHVNPVGDGENRIDILLDDEHGGLVVVANSLDRLVALLQGCRREAEGG
jgi:hypothetical protein